MNTRHSARSARALASLIALGGLLAGLPCALMLIVGNPVAGLHPGQTWLTGPTLQHLIAVVLWVLWALFTIAVTTEAAAVIRRTHTPRLPAIAPMQALAAVLIAGLLTAPTASAAAAPAASVRAGPAAVTSVAVASSPGRASAPEVTAPAPAVAASHAELVTVHVGGKHYTYRVHRGDTLWHIADAWLGDPLRWPDIYHLNQAHYDQHGRMRHGNLILPGWTLQLPADATPPPGAAPAPPPKPPKPTQPTPAHQPPPAVPPDPAASHGPSAHASPATMSASKTDSPINAAPQGPHASGAATDHSGVNLSHGWIEPALAAALSAAAGLVWAQRRRRYRPRPPTASMRLDDPDLAPMPEPIRRVRRVRRHLRAGVEQQAAPVGEFSGTEQLRESESTPHTHGRPHDAQAPSDSVALSGPGAAAAARGHLLTALTSRDPARPGVDTQVVIAADTLAGLLGADAVRLGLSPRLRVTPSLDDALAWLEQQALARARMLADNEADSLDDLAADPINDPAPPLLLICEPHDDQQQHRLAALLDQGQQLNINAVRLGATPEAVIVAGDGAITADPANGNSRIRQHGGRLTVLDAPEAVELLRVAIEADTGHTQPHIAVTNAHPQTANPVDATVVDEPQPSTAPAPVNHSQTLDVDDSATHATQNMVAGGNAGDPAAVSRPRVRIRVLGGPPSILNLPPDSKDKPPLRVKSRELLAYLVAHPRGVSEEAIFDDVLTDVRLSNAAPMLNTYVYNLRRNLRAAAGDGDYVIRHKETQRCALDRQRIDCDLWRLHQHLRAAQAATDTPARIAALKAAIAEYTGPFADGCGYDWVEPVREAIRRQYLDAASALADLLADSDRPAALRTLAEAISHDRYNEALYRQAMRLHAANGNTHAIHALRRDLIQRLTEIPAEPEEETLTLADKLVNNIRGQDRRR